MNAAAMPPPPRPPIQDRQLSSGALASNNPFRREISPAAGPPRGLSPAVPVVAAQSAPPLLNSGSQVTNPFYTPGPPRGPPPPPYTRAPSFPQQGSSSMRSGVPPQQGPGRPVPSEMINHPNLGPRPPTERLPIDPRGPPPPRQQYPASRPPTHQMPPPRHRPTRSQDATRRATNVQASAQEPLNIFATPPKAEGSTHSRRNSESSVLEAKQDARRLRDAARKRGEPKPPISKSRDPRGAKLPKKTNAQMDVIDKLDVTSMWGAGFFHHDGPFDACAPQRNRQGNREAPMNAFAEGSANNILGGRGPVQKGLDLDKIHGTGAEGFMDFNAASASAPGPEPVRQPQATALTHSPSSQLALRQSSTQSSTRRPPPPPIVHAAANRVDRTLLPERPAVIDLKSKTEPVHGPETAGLGTSTFFEGTAAPAARVAMERRTSELDTAGNGGLTRKKSLMQKIRAPSRTRPGTGDQRAASPPQEGVSPPVPKIEPAKLEPAKLEPPSRRSPALPLSAGGKTKLHDISDPFFAESGKKDPIVKVADVKDAGVASRTRNRTLSSPQNPLTRTKTTDSSSGAVGPENEGKLGGGGLLSRVKSLRRGRRES